MFQKCHKILIEFLTWQASVERVSLRDEYLWLEFVKFVLEFRQLRVGLLDDDVHVGNALFVFGNFAKVLRALFDLKKHKNGF